MPTDDHQELEKAAHEVQREGRAAEAAIYNTEAIHDKLEDIAQQCPWEETLALTASASTRIANVDDDLERELAFYNQALCSAKLAVQQFDRAGAAWRRPVDYYAEMVKSDEHMARVKEQLLFEQEQIQGLQQRRKEREAKNFGKQVAAERKIARARDKKKSISDVSALRKRLQSSGFAGDMDVDAELESIVRQGVGSGSRGARAKAAPGERFSARDKATKRVARDSKYGFGGPKRVQKQNDAYSAAAVDGSFNGNTQSSRRGDGARGRSGARGRGGGRAGLGDDGKARRPGKERRQALKGMAR